MLLAVELEIPEVHPLTHPTSMTNGCHSESHLLLQKHTLTKTKNTPLLFWEFCVSGVQEGPSHVYIVSDPHGISWDRLGQAGLED